MQQNKEEIEAVNARLEVAMENATERYRAEYKREKQKQEAIKAGASTLPPRPKGSIKESLAKKFPARDPPPAPGDRAAAADRSG